MDNTQDPQNPQQPPIPTQSVQSENPVQTPQVVSPQLPVQNEPGNTHDQAFGSTQDKSIDEAQDKPMQELVDKIERDLLGHIYTNLKENKLSGVAAQQLAQEFLALLPFKDKSDLVDKLSALGQRYPEARETYVNLGIPLEEQQRQERLDQMRAHIQSGDLDKALQVAKGGK